MNTTEIMVDHYVKVRYDDLDEGTINRAKWRILDTLGVMAAGTKGIICDKVFEVMARKGGAPESTVIGFGTKVPATSAALVNSLMARSFDFDAAMSLTDEGKVKPAHISATTVPAALAAAEVNNASGKELICALAIGDDMAARLGAFSGGGPAATFDNTGTVSGMGAAVAAAKLYGLDAAQFKNALGLMVDSVAGSMAESDEMTMAFKYPMANAAKSAIQSVELAKAGLASMSDPICGKKSFYDSFGDDYHLEGFLDSFGKTYLSDAVIKPWASCRMTHMGLDATMRATNWQPLDPDDVASFKITMHPMTPPFLTAPFAFGDTFQPHGAFSLRYTAAIAAVFGAVRPELYEPEIMADPRVGKMMERQEFDTDPSFPNNEIARCVITMNDGSVLEGQTPVTPLGDVYREPLSDDQVLDKFYRNVAFSGMVGENDARKAVELLRDLEHQESLAPVIELLCC